MALALPPRAVRNCNPGNLESGFEWLGLSKIRVDPPYCVFITPVHGFRALAIDLYTKWSRDDLETIEQIIAKYAPSNENDTEAYVRNVSDMVGVARNVPLDLKNQPQLSSLCRAIAVHEAGMWAFQTNDLEQGVSMALAYCNSPEEA